MFRRLLGLVILLVSLVLVALLLGGAYFVGQAVDAASEGLDSVLTLTVDTLDNVALTLEQTRATVAEANNAMGTASDSTVSLSIMMSDMQPLLESTTQVVSEDMPANIEAVQAAIPNIAQVAGVIDSSLTRLSNFGVSQTIPIPFNPIQLDFDLGIDYEPDEPFDDTIWALGDSLEGMPDELRSLQGDLETISTDLDMLTGNIETASGDLDNINDQVALFIPIIDEYSRIVSEINNSIVDVQGQIFEQLETVKTALVILLVFLSLTQLAPLYLGWELLSGQRSPRKTQEAEEAVPPPVVVEEAPEEIAEDIVDEEPAELELPTKVEEMEEISADTSGEDWQEFEDPTFAGDMAAAEGETMVEEPSESPTVVEQPSQPPEAGGEEHQA